MIGTDNSANLTLGLGTATPGKAKYAMRRWAHIRGQVRQGNVTLAKVDTASMPVDFMTKWKGKKQTDTAVAYLTNAKNQISTSAEASALETPTLKVDAVPYLWIRDDPTTATKLEPFVLTNAASAAEPTMRKTIGLLADFDPPPAARTERLGQLYAVYAGNMPAPDELQFDYDSFRKRYDELAQLVADRGDSITFGNVANGTVALYLGTGAKLSLVLQAIASIELKEAERAARLSPFPSSLCMQSQISVANKPTDAPGWGHHEEMSEKDYEDVKDEWMSSFAAINERKRRAEQHHNTARADDDGDPYGDHSTKQAKPETFTLEVSALEVGPSYMTLRSSKRKYQAPLPGPVVQPGAPLDAPLPNPVVQAEPTPDTSHEDPKHFAHRLFNLGGPSASRDEDEYPSRYEDPEFFYDSDARYEDQ
jgi:hypothetical protein